MFCAVDEFSGSIEMANNSNTPKEMNVFKTTYIFGNCPCQLVDEAADALDYDHLTADFDTASASEATSLLNAATKSSPDQLLWPCKYCSIEIPADLAIDPLNENPLTVANNPQHLAANTPSYLQQFIEFVVLNKEGDQENRKPSKAVKDGVGSG